MADVLTKSYLESLLEHAPRYKPITLSEQTELTFEKVMELIAVHQQFYVPRYRFLDDCYEGKYRIFAQPAKANGKPDNRLVVNFAKYITDTMTGFFIGIPVKSNHEDALKNAYIQEMNTRNNQDDVDAELSKDCDKLGTAYELLYQNELGDIGTATVSPKNCFVVYDDSVLHKPLWGIRYDTDEYGVLRGSVSDDQDVYWFREGEVSEDMIQIEGDAPAGELSDPVPHAFGQVPIIQYKENEEYRSIFEDVLNLVDAYNKAISEKANDVDYYADAYMKILGPKLDETSKSDLRDKRILNFEGDGEDLKNWVVEFMSKPESDQTQENLIDRLHGLIFQISMVADISDENFAGNSSGVALKYKLQSMSNLAMTKERKFKASLINKYKLICAYPTAELAPDDLYKINFTFTRNLPADLLDEAQTAQALNGITSQETMLSVLSIVDNPTEELNQKNEEQAALLGNMTDYGTERVEDQEAVIEDIASETVGKSLNGAQTQSLITIMAQYAAGSLTEGQAAGLIATAIGVSREQALKILQGIE